MPTRLAIIRHDAGLPTIKEQRQLLSGLNPDVVHVEKASSARAAQRIVEKIDGLQAGDVLYVCGLEVLLRSVEDTIATLAVLLQRNVACVTFDAEQRPLRIANDTEEGRLVLAMADLAAPDGEKAARPGDSRPPLTHQDLEQIRMLFREGFSARRIGLIFHRSPSVIADLVRTRSFESNRTRGATTRR